MKQHLVLKAQGDHVLQWIALKRLYMAKRGSDPNRFGKAIPRTTNADIAEITQWWQKEFLYALVRDPFANDSDTASRKRWSVAKATIDKELDSADPNAVYARNPWFWDKATSGVALYLEARKAIPSDSELIVESLKETVVEHAETVKKVAKGAADVITEAGERTYSVLKTGAFIAAGVLGAAIVLPPVIRAFRD